MNPPRARRSPPLPALCRLAVLLAASLVATVSARAAGEGPVDLEALRGKVVYLDFWASWCGPCRESFPWMNALERRMGRDDFVVLAVNVDQERADADRFLAATPAGFRIAYDPEGVLPERFHVRGMPTSVLIDRDGKVLFTHEGFRLKDRAALEKRIRAALAPD
jgi:thiol-disulfide isomerase/thioredoxin